ncbi:hypothetical protein J2W30_001089 [Variovorax boronicumulans]|uniref:hypothetical protein n=1 Tax=Variovorax boronicumulans TaxID=436515 RepID=UPI0027891CB4|nr:hypothetical protein [Variovorax boronicumulans]MDQ0033342.1 hypothetical protein [Variovorax boronicumulans]
MAVFALHACIVLLVVLLPPIVYSAVSASRYQGVDWLLFSGGVTYPLYAIYWLAKIKNPRVRFILLHLTFVLMIATATAFVSNRSAPLLVTFLPTIAAALPILGSIASRMYGRSRVAVTFLVSSLIALLVGVPSSLLIAYGMGMAAMGNMRY